MRKFSVAILMFIVAEMALLIVVGNWIGLVPTLLLVLGSMVAGFYLLKRIGVQSAKAIEQSMKRGEAPGVGVIRGFMSFVGSMLLVVPGLLTSLIGLLLIIPITQNIFKPIIFLWLRKKMKSSNVIIYQK